MSSIWVVLEFDAHCWERYAVEWTLCSDSWALTIKIYIGKNWKIKISIILKITQETKIFKNMEGY
jgi:hypothetical protein